MLFSFISSITLVLFLFITTPSLSKDLDIQIYILENIETLEFAEIEKIIEANKGNLIEMYEATDAILSKYINKANSRHQIKALLWHAAAASGTEESKIRAESALMLAKSIDDKELQFDALYRLGAEFYLQGKSDISLKYFTKCKSLTESLSLIHKLKLDLAIGLLHLYLDDIETARLLFEKNIKFFDNQTFLEQNPYQYLFSLQACALVEQKSENYRKAIEFHKKGMAFSEEIDSRINFIEFQLEYGISLYAIEKYKTSIEILLQTLAATNDSQLNHHYSLKYLFYNYIDIDSLSLAIPILDKLEKLDNGDNNRMDIILSDCYLKLDEYYLSNNQDTMRVSALSKFRDKMQGAHSERIGLQKKLSDYNNKNESIGKQGHLWITLLFLLSTVVIIFSLQSIKTGPRKEKAFIMPEKANRGDNDNSIREKLDRFEIEMGFLDAHINLNRLSVLLNTNSSYLSKIINSSKQMSFRRYINSLRINYALDLMNKNNYCESYTLRALAHECGFSSYRSFNRAFKEVTGRNPSEYITKDIITN